MQHRLRLFFLLILGLLYTVHSSASEATALGKHPPSLSLSLSPSPVSGRVTEILPADVLARILLFRKELDLIRSEMGKPKNLQQELSVTNAAPREVFFQAQTLFHKSDSLAYEFSGGYVNETVLPNVEEIRPLHVWHMVDAALKRILVVKQLLGIQEQAKEIEQDIKTTPTQVFQSIVQANRQINLLLEKKVAPSDVFERVTLASNYAAALLSEFPDTIQRPPPLAFERGKTPPDVYRRLLHILESVHETYEASRLHMLTLSVTDSEIAGSVPSDVYDIASLLVSELSYIHSKIPNKKAPPKAYYPGRKFPSHVYQRAGILEQQVANLLVKVKKNPQWILE